MHRLVLLQKLDTQIHIALVQICLIHFSKR